MLHHDHDHHHHNNKERKREKIWLAHLFFINKYKYWYIYLALLQINICILLLLNCNQNGAADGPEQWIAFRMLALHVVHWISIPAHTHSPLNPAQSDPFWVKREQGVKLWELLGVAQQTPLPKCAHVWFHANLFVWDPHPVMPELEPCWSPAR